MNKKVLVLIITILVIAIAGGIVYIICRNNNSNNQAGETIQEVLNSNKQAQESNQVINKTENNGVIEDNTTNEQETKDIKILIAFFSRAGENYTVGNVEVGNTEVMANYIADYTKGDLFKIEPVNPYPKDYEETKTIATQEINSNARRTYNSIKNKMNKSTIMNGLAISGSSIKNSKSEVENWLKNLGF